MIITCIPTNQQDSKAYHSPSESTHIHIQSSRFISCRSNLDHFESAELVESRSFIGNTKDTEIAESVICL